MRPTLNTRWRRQRAPLVLWLYLACAVAPRAVVFSHHHDGGDHEHQHAWGVDVHDDDHDHDHAEHDHDPEPANDGHPSLAADDHPHHADHVHSQLPYPLAAPLIVSDSLVVRRVEPAHAATPDPRPAPEAIARVARGPPSDLL